MTFPVGLPQWLWGLLKKSSRSVTIAFCKVGTSTCEIATGVFRGYCQFHVHELLLSFESSYQDIQMHAFFFCNSTFVILHTLDFG